MSAAHDDPLHHLTGALERGGLEPRPQGRATVRAARVLAAAGTAGAAEALRLLVADWTLAALAAGRDPGELAEALRTAAASLGRDPDALLFSACSRALTSADVRRLTPRVAVDTQLRVLRAFAGLDAAALWLRDRDGMLACVASTGAGARGHEAHRAAAVALEVGDTDGAATSAVVHRFGKAVGVVVAAGPATRGTAAFVEETAAALGFFVERDLLLERNARRERTLTAGLEERLLRHAFDLHDGPLQDLAALASDLALARRQIVPLVEPAHATAVEGRLDDLEARLHGLDDALRATLRPLTAPAAGCLADAIRREVSSLRAGSRVDASVEIRGDVEILTAEQRRAVVRIVQEALSNVVHHSRAHSVRVRLSQHDGRLAVSVEDDGRGFDLRRALATVADRRRFGLVGMHERVRLLGGDLAIDTAPGAGCCVSFALQPQQPLVEA